MPKDDTSECKRYEEVAEPSGCNAVTSDSPDTQRDSNLPESDRVVFEVLLQKPLKQEFDANEKEKQ